MDKIRIAIQGSGIIACYHARACQEVPDVEVVAAANWRSESLSRFAKEWDIPYTTTSFDELAADPDIDAVIVTLPNFLHKSETLRMLQAGKHVLVEKPMAMNAIEAEEMVNAAKAAHRVLMVGHMWRFDNEVKWLRDIVANGLLGDIVKIEGYHLNPAGVGPKGWFNSKEMAGGGVVIDMAIHSIDMTRFLLGEALPVKVYAQMGTYYSSYEVEDDVTMVVNWDNGVYSTIVAGSWQPFVEAAEGAQEVWGTRGYGRVFPSKLYLPMADVPGTFIPTFPKRKEQCDWPMYRGQIEHFVTCIREGLEPKPGGADGLLMMKVVDGAYESARSGMPVIIK